MRPQATEDVRCRNCNQQNESQAAEDVRRNYNQQHEYRDDVEKVPYFRRCHDGYLLSELGGVRQMGRKLIELATDGEKKRKAKLRSPLGDAKGTDEASDASGSASLACNG